MLVVPPTPTPRPAFYRPELDGLRFFAFAFVFMSHAFSQNPDVYARMGIPRGLAFVCARFVGSGGNGVLLFFVLSSYLITSLLLREHERFGVIRLRDFYARRALRIMPLYFGFIAAVYLLIPQGSHAALETKLLPGFLLFLANWSFLLPNITTGGGVAGVLWSVSVEEQFYLLWALALRGFGVAKIGRMAAVLIGTALATRALMIAYGASIYALTFNTFCLLDAIGAGALLALAFRRGLPTLSAASRAALLLAGPLAWTASSCLWVWGYSYNLLAAVNLVGAIAMICGTLGGRLLSPAPLVYLGRISYGLYVFHAAAIYVAQRALPPSVRQIALAFGLTLTAAALSYQFFEAPFLRLKRRFTHVASRPVDGTAADPEPAAVAGPATAQQPESGAY
ncbi:MAG: acyltransferase family protein [Pyrinomonadaceae bacterium]